MTDATTATPKKKPATRKRPLKERLAPAREALAALVAEHGGKKHVVLLLEYVRSSPETLLAYVLLARRFKMDVPNKRYRLPRDRFDELSSFHVEIADPELVGDVELPCARGQERRVLETLLADPAALYVAHPLPRAFRVAWREHDGMRTSVLYPTR